MIKLYCDAQVYSRSLHLALQGDEPFKLTKSKVLAFALYV